MICDALPCASFSVSLSVSTPTTLPPPPHIYSDRDLFLSGLCVCSRLIVRRKRRDLVISARCQVVVLNYRAPYTQWGNLFPDLEKPSQLRILHPPLRYFILNVFFTLKRLNTKGLHPKGFQSDSVELFSLSMFSLYIFIDSNIYWSFPINVSRPHPCTVSFWDMATVRE